jgi:heptaprenylglyceryl phosphate synthase
MNKRLLDYTPKEVMLLDKKAYLDGVRASEGRTVGAFMSPSVPNVIDKVSNLEACAAFGADIIYFEYYDVTQLQMPGLPSKNPADDQICDTLRLQMGRGWSIEELKRLVGRPIGTGVVAVRDEQEYSLGFAKTLRFSKELLFAMKEAGFTHVMVAGDDQDSIVRAVEQATEWIGDKVIIESGIIHGPGYIDDRYQVPYNIRNVTSPEFVQRLAKAGADVVMVPAAGVTPGITVEYVTELVTAIHEANVLASAAVVQSVESARADTAEMIAIANKMCGMDILYAGAGGLNASMPQPEFLQALSIAVRGKRHTYRLMCQSPMR